MLVITDAMQSAGGEGGGEEEGQEESSGQEETNSRLQDSSNKSAEDCEAKVPPAQEVCYLSVSFVTFYSFI